MAKSPKKSVTDRDITESFLFVLKQIDELRFEHQALKLALFEKGLFAKKDFDLALEVVREEHQRKGEELAQAIRAFRGSDALLAGNPGAKKTKQ